MPVWLERTLSTTNVIENLNSAIRRVTRNVKRWRDGSMIKRWVATAIFEAQRGFRRDLRPGTVQGEVVGHDAFEIGGIHEELALLRLFVNSRAPRRGWRREVARARRRLHARMP